MDGRLRWFLRHPVTVNAAALYAGQFAVSVLPLVVLPYLARVLGPAELGVVVFVQYFSFLVGAVLEYGFGLSATREVARTRSDGERLAATVAAVVGAKALLTVACLLISLALWPLLPIFRDAPELLALGVALAVAQGLSPGWFYGGVEWLVFPTVVEFLSRAAAAAGVLVLVDGSEDAALVLLIYATASLVATSLLHARIYSRVSLRRPSIAEALGAMRQASTLFVSSAAVTIYNTVGIFVLGTLMSAAQVGVFSGAEKIIRAAQRVLASAGEAVYPRVSFLVRAGRDRSAARLAAAAAAALTGVAALAAAALALLADPLVRLLYGPEFASAVPLLQILAASLPLAILAGSLSTLWLLPHGRDRAVTTVVVLSCVLAVVLVGAAASSLGLEAAAWSLVVVELVTVTGLVVAVRRSATPAPTHPAKG